MRVGRSCQRMPVTEPKGAMARPTRGSPRSLMGAGITPAFAGRPHRSGTRQSAASPQETGSPSGCDDALATNACGNGLAFSCIAGRPGRFRPPGSCHRPTIPSHLYPPRTAHTGDKPGQPHRAIGATPVLAWAAVGCSAPTRCGEFPGTPSLDSAPEPRQWCSGAESRPEPRWGLHPPCGAARYGRGRTTPSPPVTQEDHHCHEHDPCSGR